MSTRHPPMFYSLFFLLGRLLVGGVYLFSGVTNLLALNNLVFVVSAKGVPNPQIWVMISCVLLIIAGISILTGIRPQVGVGALALFLIPATFIMHNFWALEGMEQLLQMRSFLGNVGLLGSALMFLAIPRPWAMSLDHGVKRAASTPSYDQTVPLK
jgi:putative oxidoreductase